jgi:hypothetical protein
MSKLEHYGIMGTFKPLIESYLVDRYQRVVIKDTTNNTNYSNWKLIKHGVPQGSNLGPLFFLLYTNDLANVTTKNAKVVLCADDTSLIINSPSPTQFTEKLQTVFIDFAEWFKNNLLTLKLSKTTYIQTYSFEQRIAKQWAQKLCC